MLFKYYSKNKKIPADVQAVQQREDFSSGCSSGFFALGQWLLASLLALFACGVSRLRMPVGASAFFWSGGVFIAFVMAIMATPFVHAGFDLSGENDITSFEKSQVRRATRSSPQTNYFDENTGLLSLASVNIPDSTGGFERYSVTLQLVPNSNPLEFTVLDHDTPVVPKETAYFSPTDGKLAFSIGFMGGEYYWVEMDVVSQSIGPLTFKIAKIESAKGTYGYVTVSKFGDKANSVWVNSTGYGGSIGCGSKCWSAFSKNSNVTLSVTPPADTIVRWLAGCDSVSSNGNSCVVVAKGIRNVEVSLTSKVDVGIVGQCVTTSGVPTPQSVYASNPAPSELIDFGSTQVGTTMFNHFVINKPANNYDLCVEILGKNGANPEDFYIVEPDFPIKIPYTKISTPVIMKCTPSEEGIRQAVLTLKTNDGANSIVNYNLQCNGVSEAQPGYWSDPFPGTEINFGGVERNRESSTKKIAITESGQLPLDVYYQKIEGENASDFIFKGPFVSTLQNDSPQTVMEVACRPSDLGWREATLKLGSNDPDLKEISHPLKCEGVPWCIVDFPPADDPSGIMGFLGGGYDSSRDRFKPERCLNGKQTEIGHFEAYLDGDVTYDYHEIEEELGMSGGLKLKFKFFKMNAAASFLKEAQETEFSRSLLVKFKLLFPNGKFELDHENPLSSIGESNIRSPSCWRNACGSHYISQTKRGAVLYMLMKFSFNSKEEKKHFSGKLGAKLGSFASLRFAIQSISRDFRESGSVTIKAMQRGGDATKLVNLFGATADKIDPTIQCSLGNDGMEACEEVMNNIIVYAKEAFVEDAQEHPVTLDYYYSRYNELNIGAPDVEVIPPEILVAREELKAAYERELRNLSVVENWLDNYTFPEKKSNGQVNTSELILNQLQDKINFNLELIRTTAAWCFSDLTQCVSKQVEALTPENIPIQGKGTMGLFKVYHYTPVSGVYVGVSGVSMNAQGYSFSIHFKDSTVSSKDVTVLLEK